jgi:phage tail-like protein
VSLLDLLADAAPFEKALAAAMQDTLPVPLRAALSAADAPAAFVPFLAAHESVDLWFDDWSLPRKRAMIDDALRLARLKGTRLGLREFLAYVDAQVISAVAHPRRFVLGRSAVGIQPLQFPAYTARYLIKVGLKRHVRSFALGRAAAGKHGVLSVDREPIRRAKIAASVSKGPGTQYTATFAHRRRPTFGDGIGFGDGHHFGDFVDRTSL